MGQQRQRAWLVGSLRTDRIGWGQVAQQQPDQALFHVEAGQPGRPGDGMAHLLFGHRPEDHSSALQRRGQARVAERTIKEICTQRQYHPGGFGQCGDLGHEFTSLRLVVALGEDRLELVHYDRRCRGFARGLEIREHGPECGEWVTPRFQQTDRAGKPRHETCPQQ